MAFYDRYNYQKYWQGRGYEHLAEIIALERFLNQIPNKNKKTLVDVGCGFGRLTPFYQSLFNHCFLVEPSPKLLKQAQKKLSSCPSLDFIEGDWQKLSLPQKVDVALMVRVAHHIEDVNLAIKTISRHLNKNGFFILEFANKINFKSRLVMFFRGQWHFCRNPEPRDRRSPKNINQETILFLNHHPQTIYTALNEAGLEVVDQLSVSNFRWLIIKKNIPPSFLIKAEKKLQAPLAKINFGPSIFVLAHKR